MQPVSLTRAKSVALLLYLAATRRSQPRERVLDLLWPESLPQAARKNMRNMLWEIGDVVGNEVLVQDGPTLSLAPAVAVDIHTFEDGLLLLQSGDASALETATAHYRGPLADGLAVHEAPEFELWLTAERERLASIYLRLLERIIALHQAAGNPQAVVDQAQLALAADPLREPIHLALIEANMQLGRRAQALQQYAALVTTLRRELDVDPLPATTAHYEALLAGSATPRVPSAQLVATPAQPANPAPTMFVGRAAELALLDEELDRAAQGSTRIVMITGDMGMGKSRLWQHWAATRAHQLRVLPTHALETREPVPFGPLLALFRQPGPAQALLKSPSALGPIWLAELARLLPEVTASGVELPPPLALPPPEERGRLLQALTEAMRALASPGPGLVLTLVLDDLHWADPSTLDWLVTLADQLRHTPLLIIGTHRLQDAPEHLNRIVAGWQRTGQLRNMAVPHLTDDEAQRLLNARGIASADAQLAHWVRQSGGNPLFLMELSRATSQDPPDDLVALIRARLHTTVPAFAQQVLQAAAILGSEARFATLQDTSGRSEDETVDALDALTAIHVLTAQDNAYGFVHPLFGTVVRQSLAPARRELLHRRAAITLERDYAPKPERVAAQLMEHFAAAGHLKPAAHYAELASDQAAAIDAYVEAALLARRALAWEPTPQRRLKLGAALAIAGPYEEAQSILELAADELEREDDVAGLTRALFMLTLMTLTNNHPQNGRKWLARVPMERVQHLAPELTAQVYLAAATLERQSQNYAAVVANMDHAQQLAQQHQLVSLEGQIAFERGNLLSDRGEHQAALAVFEDAVRLGQRSGNLMMLSMSHNNLAYQTLLTGDLVRAREHLQSTLALAEQYALSFLWQYAHSTHGEIALAEHNLDEAEAAFARAFEAAQAWNNRAQMANVRINQAYVAHARHQPAQTHARLAEARELSVGTADLLVHNRLERAYQQLDDPVRAE